MASVQIIKKNKTQYVRIVESYWDKEVKKPKIREVKFLGKLEDFTKDNPNFVEELKEFVSSKKNKKQKDRNEQILQIMNSLKLNKFKGTQIKGYGNLVYEEIMNYLELPSFLIDLQKKNSRSKYDLASITKILILTRILEPSSKRSSVEKIKKYWYEFNDSLKDVYRSLEFLQDKKVEILNYLNEQFVEKINRNLTFCFYDVTTVYFESFLPDELRKFGFSKDNKVNQTQVVLGLLIDDMGIPIYYDLFPGNTSDFLTLKPVLENIKRDLGIEKITIVADRGLNSKSNLLAIKEAGYDYIMAYKIKGKENKIEGIYDFETYKMMYEEFGVKKQDHKEFFKSNNTFYEIDNKLILTFSRKRQRKDKKDRERLIKKAEKLLNLSAIKSEMKRGDKKYLKFAANEVELDHQVILKDEAADGFYGILTSHEDMDEKEIIKQYSKLWKIEESFRVMKTNFELRPIFLSTEKAIKGHFLIFFLALTIQRYLEFVLDCCGYPMPTNKIIDAIKNQKLSIIPEINTYIKTEESEDFKTILKVLGIKPIETIGKYEDIKFTI
ncbi:IS1634 family transposase [Mycoplasmopsis synoviae]|uniref:IS1634 family transposase n=2 Tax=Mycoplasmopsis synoviae TaxID=2109 RepID=UPI00387B147C